MDEKALGKRLQLARQRAGLTQQELCQKAGLSYSTLAKIERGAIRSPSVFTVATIARVTQVPLEDLLNFSQKLADASQSRKKHSKTGVTFAYFDINDVLVRFFHRAYMAIAEDTGIPSDRIEIWFLRHNPGACSGQTSLEEFNHAMAKELGLKSFDWSEYYLAAVEPTPGIGTLLNWAAEYYEVGLITNSLPGAVDKLIKNKLLPDINYAAIVDSSKIKALKPQKRMFEAAQNLAGREPHEILLVDNERNNRVAADELGWQVIGFNEYDPGASIEKIKKTLEF